MTIILLETRKGGNALKHQKKMKGKQHDLLIFMLSKSFKFYFSVTVGTLHFKFLWTLSKDIVCKLCFHTAGPFFWDIGLCKHSSLSCILFFHIKGNNSLRFITSQTIFSGKFVGLISLVIVFGLLTAQLLSFVCFPIYMSVLLFVRFFLSLWVINLIL